MTFTAASCRLLIRYVVPISSNKTCSRRLAGAIPSVSVIINLRCPSTPH